MTWARSCSAMQPLEPFRGDIRDRYFQSAYYADAAQRQVQKERLGTKLTTSITWANVKTDKDINWLAALAHLRDHPRLLRVERSEIHRYGLFAKEFIRDGDVILEFPEPKFVKSPKYLQNVGLKVSSEKYIDPNESQGLGQFINHSCSPNCSIVFDKKHVIIVAKEDIRPNTELTLDYQMEPGPKKLALTCNCGSSSCRGWLNYQGEKDERAEAKKKKREEPDRTVLLRDAQVLIPNNKAVRRVLREALGIPVEEVSEESEEEDSEEESDYEEESPEVEKKGKKQKPEEKTKQQKASTENDREKKRKAEEAKRKKEEEKEKERKRKQKEKEREKKLKQEEKEKKRKQEEKEKEKKRKQEEKEKEKKRKKEEEEKKRKKEEEKKKTTSKKADDDRKQAIGTKKNTKTNKNPPEAKPDGDNENSSSYDDEMTNVFSANLYGEDVVVWGGGMVNPEAWTPPESDFEDSS